MVSNKPHVLQFCTAPLCHSWELTLLVSEVAAAEAADLDTGLAQVLQQAQRQYCSPLGVALGEASWVFLLCQLAGAESCCASLPVQLQQHMTWHISRAWS